MVNPLIMSKFSILSFSYIFVPKDALTFYKFFCHKYEEFKIYWGEAYQHEMVWIWLKLKLLPFFFDIFNFSLESTADCSTPLVSFTLDDEGAKDFDGKSLFSKGSSSSFPKRKMLSH